MKTSVETLPLLASREAQVVGGQPALIETDAFDFEFLGGIAERESWRKEIHRPIYHTHKWWAKRLGSVFRGILLGCLLPADSDLRSEFYRRQDYAGVTAFDPFMGSGTTIGEAHKLGLTAVGRDINPVAAEAVRVALGGLDEIKLRRAFDSLSASVGEELRAMYASEDSRGEQCEVLYYFWVMQAGCPTCRSTVDLFSSWVFARNAYPRRKPEVQVLCPKCDQIFEGRYDQPDATCDRCGHDFNQDVGVVNGRSATCPSCRNDFRVLDTLSGEAPSSFRLYAKLVLTREGRKEYLAANAQDLARYEECSSELKRELEQGALSVPSLELADGNNTRQAISYGFKRWRDFHNDRQLLGLAKLHRAISEVKDTESRDALLLLFSGALEFNNMFASYKGEGTGAVRHMFSHHILKPERTPIEANIWGTSKSSGSFSGLFAGRLLKAISYRRNPLEIVGSSSGQAVQCSAAFAGQVHMDTPLNGDRSGRAIYLSCGDSSETGFPASSIDLVVTDPPFFDNVHYSELADFFYAWQQLTPRGFVKESGSTRSAGEVQDAQATLFSHKLASVFRECHRVLKPSGLLVFTYHHSRDEGWDSVARAVVESGFVVVNAHPVKSEMSGATPKSQAKSPIQIDAIVVCRKDEGTRPAARSDALGSAASKIRRMSEAGIKLSLNDERVIANAQLLTTIGSVRDLSGFAWHSNGERKKTA